MQSMLQKSMRMNVLKNLTPAQAMRKSKSLSTDRSAVVTPTSRGLKSMVNVGKLDELGEPRFLENVKMFLGRAAQKTEIPDDMYRFIQACNSVIRFNIPLKMDDGSIRTIPCYR